MRMTCEQFQRSYSKFDAASNVVHFKDFDSKEYMAYSDHMQDCHTCRDWFQTEQIKDWKLDLSDYPCIHMAYHANYRCASHQDPWDCPSALIAYVDQYEEYGLPIRDGGTSYWKIDNCPWCGVALPQSRRDVWMRKLRALGFDPINDYEKIPAEFKSARWYKDSGYPGLRLVQDKGQ